MVVAPNVIREVLQWFAVDLPPGFVSPLAVTTHWELLEIHQKLSIVKVK